jgi:ribosomal protein S18 acetylase RimI-like enzyme
MMILRSISLADLDELVALSRRAFTDAFGRLYAAEDLAAFLDAHRAPERFAAMIEDREAMVIGAELNGSLTGYCTVQFGQGFDERPAPRPRRPALLGQLYCSVEATGKGIGAALLERAIEAARERGCDALQLSVYSENFGAQRFYQRYGFRHVADIDFWVGNHRDDEFLYELAL